MDRAAQGGPDAATEPLEEQRLDAAIPTNDAPFLGGNFVYEGLHGDRQGLE